MRVRARINRIVGAVGVALLPLAACNAIAGLGDYQVVEGCQSDCGIPDHVLVERETGIIPDSNSSVAEEGTDGDADAGPVIDFSWARWPMPNPRDAEVDVNLASYQVNNGVVTDLVTNLQWQATSAVTAGSVTQAKKMCSDAGWRLPTRIELVTLIDYTRRDSPAIDEVFQLRGSSSFFWTASPVMTSDGAMITPDGPEYWSVNFWNGAVVPDMAPPIRGVLCVRGGQ